MRSDSVFGICKTFFDVFPKQCRALVERAALLIAALLVREYGAPRARVSVYKPDALDGVKGIGVTIERTAGEIRELERRGVL